MHNLTSSSCMQDAFKFRKLSTCCELRMRLLLTLLFLPIHFCCTEAKGYNFVSPNNASITRLSGAYVHYLNEIEFEATGLVGKLERVLAVKVHQCLISISYWVQLKMHYRQ